MRLSKELVNIIVNGLYDSFGVVDVYLFGSRTDDTLTGGDIDLAIDCTLPREEFRHLKAVFLASLIKKNLELQFDIVQLNTADGLFLEEINRTKIKLAITNRQS